ncbi:50S ribosomal protein L35 [Candidatus Dependentiae bacterium]|nr:MAG: 50S ribosomal protein L35 [Candidatus Dependentiae bacterium]
MSKLKRKSAAKKRFKITGKNKIKRSRAYRRHLLTKKSSKAKRQLRKGCYIAKSDERRIANLLR